MKNKLIALILIIIVALIEVPITLYYADTPIPDKRLLFFFVDAFCAFLLIAAIYVMRTNKPIKLFTPWF